MVSDGISSNTSNTTPPKRRLFGRRRGIHSSSHAHYTATEMCELSSTQLVWWLVFFICRIIALFVSVVSDMGSKHHDFMDLHGFGAPAWSWREIVYHEECIYTASCTAIALHSIHLFQTHCILFSLTHPGLYSYGFTPGLHIRDMGFSWALWPRA